MALQISLVKKPEKASVAKSAQLFTEKGGTLGRGDNNTWVLPDPDRFLSTCHCEIIFDSGRYYIIDLSTNGTFLNSSPQPLGKGAKSPLNNGDSFEIGDYQFSAALVESVPPPEASPFGQAPTPAFGDDIFSHPEPYGFSSSDPFAAPHGDFSSSDIPLSPDIANMDPLVALDQARQAEGDELFHRHSDLGGKSLADGQVDYSPNMDQSITWPDSQQENLIPEDWEDDLLGGSSSSLPPIAPAQIPVQPFAEKPSVAKPEVRETEQPPAVNFGAKEPAPELDEEAALFARPAPAVPLVDGNAGAPKKGPVPVRATSRSAAPENKALSPDNADQRLIAAMGLDAGKLSSEQIGEIGDMVGGLMREIVDGMMQVLRSRTNIKNEFRMNVTTIQPVENNPLKFSVGVDEALENMFIKKSNAYKKPVDAFSEGFQEIGEHQVAMIAGIRQGFERMMARFDPQVLESRFNKQGKSAVIPGMQKARYWSAYSEYFNAFEDNMETSFQHLFGSDFVQAYEEQLRGLAAARKKNKVE